MLQNRPDMTTTAGPPALPVSAPATPERPSPVPASVSALAVALGFRKYASFLIFVVLIVGYERVAPPEHKLSAIIGAFEGNSEAASLRAKLDSVQQTLAMQNAENAKMQNEVNRYKAELENMVNQYKAVLELQKQVLAKRQDAVVESQKDKLETANLADMIALLMSLGGNKDVATKTAAFGNTLRQQAYREIDAQAPNGADLGSTAAPPLKAATAPASSALRLVRVGAKTPDLLVRSAPQKDGSSVVCVLPAGAVVKLLGQSEYDPAHKITFVRAAFDRQGYGNTTGWISQWSLEDLPPSSPEGTVPQVCREPAP